MILTTLPHGHQSHPTSHILRTPGSHCDSQKFSNPPIVRLIIFYGPEVIRFTYHCNIGVSPVAIITLVNKAGRLASKNSQGFF